MADNGKLSSDNVKRVGHLDIAGGGQVEVHGNYCYVGHMDPPHGTSIIDISDPKNPKVVSTLAPPPYSHTHKVRVVGDLMYTNVEMINRHKRRRGVDKIIAAQNKLGGNPSHKDLAHELGIDEELVADIIYFKDNDYDGGGWRVHDISDKTKPKELSYTRTHGFGTHRFHCDEEYAYISTEMEGYVGNILVVYDMKDPTKPEDISHWWMPGQHLAGGEKPTWSGYSNRLHHAMRCGDELWAGAWMAGFRVIDASDIRNLKTIGEIDHHPLVKDTSHTIMPLEQKIDGRRIAIAVDEAHDPIPGQYPARMWIIDATDIANMKFISSFSVSELASPYASAGRFGAHQYREKLDTTLVYVTWFSGGLRIVDVADPLWPKEVGHFIPEPASGFSSPQSNDVDVADDTGLIYMIDRNVGLDIIEFTDQ
jgi:hypothetical protein